MIVQARMGDYVLDTHLRTGSPAAQMPAAALADSLGFLTATAVRWRHQAGADWNRYAAELARERNHEPGE